MSNPILDDGFQHANQAAGSAGSTTGVPTTPAIGAANSWKDVFGNTASIITDASTTSHAMGLTNAGGNNLLNGAVVRPTSEGGANLGVLSFHDLNSALGLVSSVLRYTPGTGPLWNGYWGNFGNAGGGQTSISVFAFDGVGGFASAGNTSAGPVFDPTHYYATWIGAVDTFIEAAFFDLGTVKPAQTGAVPVLPAATRRVLFANSASAGSSTTPTGVSIGNAGGGNILRVLTYPTSISLSLSVSSALVNTSIPVTLTGTFTDWTPGTPGAPTITAVKAPTNDCGVSAQVVASYKSASITLATGATSGTITISVTDPTTARTSTATITVASTATITLTSPENFQLFQRSPAITGTSGTIAIAGTNNDTAPHSIEASWNGGSYFTIGTAIAAGAPFSGTLIHQPNGTGTLTVRFVDTPSTFIQATHVSVGIQVLLLGQSNGLGQGDNNQVYQSENMKASMQAKNYHNRELLDPTGDNTGQVDPVGTGQGAGSVWPLVATHLLANLGIPISFIPACEGGTTISQWVPQGSGHQDRTTLYGSAVHRAVVAGGVELALWWQGESDNTTPGATYQAALATIAAAIVADLGCKLMPCLLQNGSANAIVNTAILNEMNTDPNVLKGPDLSDLVGGGLVPDGLHLKSNAALGEAGARWAKKMMDVYQPAGSTRTIGHGGGQLGRGR